MSIDHKKERSADVEKIRSSSHPKKVIVAGPGTGKSFLFTELIKKKKEEGKNNFLAITFMGKLGDFLADDLCGLAETRTMHSFARTLVSKYCPDWEYYPRMLDLIREDLEAEGNTQFQIGDKDYKTKSKYYRAMGDDDVVNYAVQICKKDPEMIPRYDLILIDEYQDFNATESELIDILAQKNEIVIVGDDDQALYGFKGSSPIFIREKHAPGNKDFESHTLRFCSRCTEVVIKYFHALVKRFNLNAPGTDRINKEYICYIPDKSVDSEMNPKIHLLKQCPPGMIAYKIRNEIEKVSSKQKIKDILVIGEGQSCKSILESVARQLRNYGFKNIEYKGGEDIFCFRQDIISAYKFLAKDKESLLGWRILGNPSGVDQKRKHLANAKTLNTIIHGAPSKIKAVKDDEISELEGEIEGSSISDKNVRNNLLFQQLKYGNTYLDRPLCNFNITICSILSSKGLGADLVFLVGFDQGKFPVKKNTTDSEVYQMLVAITRTKKRIYLINTVGSKVSDFITCLETKDMEVEEINL